MRRVSSWVCVMAVLGAAALVSACGSTSSTTSSTGPAPTTASSSSTAGGAPTGVTACRSNQLSASRLATSAAAGHVVVTYGLRNTSSGVCTQFGYPGVQLVDASGHALPTQVSHGGSYTFTAQTPVAVTLTPGAQASFFLGYTDVPSGGQTTCPSSARVDITPPGAATAIAVADRIAPCGNTVAVSPVHAGTAPPP